MEADDFDSYSPSVDVIAMVMMAALVNGHDSTHYDEEYRNEFAEQAYELADALKARRDCRYLKSERIMGKRWDHGIMRYLEISQRDSVMDVLHERCDQILKHCFDLEHDRKFNNNDNLVGGAASVLLSYQGEDDVARQGWPLGQHEERSGTDFEIIIDKTPYEKLTVAAALILAEMDRIG